MKHIAVVAYTRARGAGSHTPFLLVGNTHHAQCPIFTFFSPQPMYGTWYFFILFYTLVHNSHTLFMNKKKVHRPPTTSTFVIRWTRNDIMCKRTKRQPPKANTTGLPISFELLLPPAPPKQERVKGQCYVYKGQKKCWKGTQFRDACAHPECTTHPTYNVEGEAKALYCKTHATDCLLYTSDAADE